MIHNNAGRARASRRGRRVVGVPPTTLRALFSARPAFKLPTQRNDLDNLLALLNISLNRKHFRHRGGRAPRLANYRLYILEGFSEVILFCYLLYIKINFHRSVITIHTRDRFTHDAYEINKLVYNNYSVYSRERTT